MTMTTTVQEKPCPVCDQSGERVPIKKVEGGVLWRVTHEDGKTHEWTAYHSLESYAKATIVTNTRDMVCPRCKEHGYANWTHTNDKTGIRLFVRHGKVNHWMRKNIEGESGNRLVMNVLKAAGVIIGKD